MAILIVPPCASEDTSASSSLTVVDGVGRAHVFDRIPEKIVTIGTGLTATAIDLGLLDRMIVCDRYSVSDSHDLFDPLRSKVESGEIRANGSAYSTGLESIIVDIVTMVDLLDLADGQEVHDVAIFMTGTSVAIDTLYNDLSDSRYDFKHILCWNTIDSYDELVDMVKKMSLVMKGEVDPVVDEMEALVEYIDTVLNANPNSSRREAFYVTYSAGELKVGNIGSLANSMIEVAGGISITNDSDMAKTYATNIPQLLETYGDDVVIFVDNVLASNESNMDALRKAIGGQEVTLVKLDSLWNNYCIKSMDGVWAMACAMYSDAYPDKFIGDVPVISNDYDGDFTILAIAGLFGAVLIAILALLYFRS